MNCRFSMVWTLLNIDIISVSMRVVLPQLDLPKTTQNWGYLMMSLSSIRASERRSDIRGEK